MKTTLSLLVGIFLIFSGLLIMSYGTYNVQETHVIIKDTTHIKPSIFVQTKFNNTNNATIIKVSRDMINFLVPFSEKIVLVKPNKLYLISNTLYSISKKGNKTVFKPVVFEYDSKGELSLTDHKLIETISSSTSTTLLTITGVIIILLGILIILLITPREVLEDDKLSTGEKFSTIVSSNIISFFAMIPVLRPDVVSRIVSFSPVFSKTTILFIVLLSIENIRRYVKRNKQ